MAPDNGRTFGRRGVVPSAPASVAAAPTGEPGPGALPTIFRSRLAKQLGGILVGVGILLFLQAIYVVTMKGFGRALDQHWQQNFGYPGIEDAYLRTMRRDATLDAAHNHCKARADFVRLEPAQRSALEGFDGLYSGETALAKAAVYLSCLMAQKPVRFCQPVHRAHLVAALSDYYKLMAKVRDERWVQTTTPFAVERGQLIGSHGSGPFGPPSAPPSAQTDPRVVDGLRTLVGAGYITRRDLGELPRVAAAELEGRLRGIEGKRPECA